MLEFRGEGLSKDVCVCAWRGADGEGSFAAYYNEIFEGFDVHHVVLVFNFNLLK